MYLLKAKSPDFFQPQLPASSNEIECVPLRSRVPFLEYSWFNCDELAEGKFSFLNETVDCGIQIDWHGQSTKRLWRYNLHYFQYLHPSGLLDTSVALPLMRDWIVHNSPGTPDAWDSYPISLRIVNWVKYLSKVNISKEELEPLSHSVYNQALWLERRLEWDILGNHLIKNLKALIFAGLFFKSNDAKRWLNKGLKLIKRQLREQILPDGGHMERSLMYHSMILEDCLDLLNLCKASPCNELQDFSVHLEPITHEMIRFLVGMLHPDGQIALFNSPL